MSWSQILKHRCAINRLTNYFRNVDPLHGASNSTAPGIADTDANLIQAGRQPRVKGIDCLGAPVHRGVFRYRKNSQASDKTVQRFALVVIEDSADIEVG